MFRPYVSLFQSAHIEELLAPIAGLVAEARRDGITVWALNDFTPAHMTVIGDWSSCAITGGDALPVRTVILNNRQVQSFHEDLDIDFKLCLEMTFLHEEGHIRALDRGGIVAAQSEFDAWEFVAPRTSALREDYENLRGHCMWHRSPGLMRPVDTTPQFWKDFLRLGKQIGYQMAWAGAQADIQRQGLQPWDVLRILKDDCKLPFEIAYPLSESEDIEYTLFRLAAHRSDHAELDRMPKPKPAPAKRIPPEQPLPPGYVG